MAILNWRTSGDCSLEDWTATLPITSRIRQAGEVEDCYHAAQGLTRLCLGQLAAESSYATDFNGDPPANKNALNLRPRGGSGFQVFPTWAAGVSEWKNRLLDPAYAYAPTQTVAELVAVYAPASDANDESAYAKIIETVMARLTPLQEPTAMTTLNMTRDLIPLPAIQMDIITDAENSAWDDLGPKEVWGFVLHRQLGTNATTRVWFRRGKASTGLTEFGQQADGGELLLWNSPEGFGGQGVSPNRAPWASGVYNVHGDAWGDGLKFVQKYGLNAVNGKQVAWEIDLGYNDVWSDKAQQDAAQACAHYAHNYGITWDQFPVHPKDGFSFVRWHQEITGPAEKVCPGPVVMAATPAWIEKVRAIMKTAQTGTTAQPTPPPKQPKWAQKHPIKQAGPKTYALNRKFTATRDVTPVQQAVAGAPATGPDVKQGTVILAVWMTADDDGNLYIVGSGGSRMPLSAFQ